jgi:alpha-1,6-mannosyltransferase
MMPDRWRTAAVALLGAALVGLAYAVHGLVDLAVYNASYVALVAAMFAVCLAAAALLWRRARRVDVVVVLAVAVVARALLAFDSPTLSNDAYRFVWDGRVQAAGINPYRYPPAAERLRPLRDFDVFTQVNRPFTRTLYPPTNELAYVAAHETVGGGVVRVKLAFLALEVVVVALLLVLLGRAGVSRGRVALYAWHPLAVVEIAASGHPDALLLALTLGALLLWGQDRRVGAGAALGAAALTKFVPLLLAPFMARRGGVRFAAALGATAALLYLPYAGAGSAAFGSVHEYTEESFGAGPYRWLTDLGMDPGAARALLLAGLAALVTWTAARPARNLREASRAAALLFGGAVLASANVQPWYLLWMLPFLCVAPVAGLLWATAAVPAFYLAVGPTHHAGQGVVSLIVWGPCVALLAGAAVRSWWRRPHRAGSTTRWWSPRAPVAQAPEPAPAAAVAGAPARADAGAPRPARAPAFAAAPREPRAGPPATGGRSLRR